MASAQGWGCPVRNGTSKQIPWADHVMGLSYLNPSLLEGGKRKKRCRIREALGNFLAWIFGLGRW